MSTLYSSRCISTAILWLIWSLVLTRYMLFCILRCRRFARSTAFDVAGNSESSRKVNAFSRFGDHSFLSVSLSAPKRLIRRRSLASFSRAVSIRQRRSNKRYTSSMIARRVRNESSPRVIHWSIFFSLWVRVCLTNKWRCSNSAATFFWTCWFFRAICFACCPQGRPRGRFIFFRFSCLRAWVTTLRMSFVISCALFFESELRIRPARSRANINQVGGMKWPPAIETKR